MDELIEKMAEKHGTDADLLREMLEWERSKVHLERRRGKIQNLRGFLESYVAQEKP